MDLHPNIFKFDQTEITWYKSGTGKPLLILHGWGSSSAVMMPIVRNLQSKRTCYLIDFPGFGNSPEPNEPWDIGMYAASVKAFIKDVIGSEPVDLLVHSFGARVLLKMLSNPDHKELFDKILITGGAGLKPKRSFKFYLKSYTAKALKFPFLILPGSLRESALSKLRKTSLWKSLGSSDYQNLSDIMRQTFVLSVTEFFDDSLNKIDHDILLLWGRDDAATPLEQGKRLESGLKNGALVVIDNAGHYAFLDNPGQFNAIASSYFSNK